MLNRRHRALVLALVMAGAMINLIDRVEGQTGTARVSSDLELLGIGGMNGGGHLTWTLTGDQARLLRLKIQNMYDRYGNIPAGFAYAGNLTNANGNGRIDSLEANKYTDFLENELEGIRFGGAGTGIEVRYVKIDRADIIEKGFPVERSSEGLVGTNQTSSELLEIRFIFNAKTISENWRFRFSDVVLANALHRVFDMRQAQQVSTFPWPLLQENGWHTVLYSDGLLALWHGNLSTYNPANPASGRYDNSTTATDRTVTDAFVGTTWTDLQFATWANVTFAYNGSVADAGDRLRFQIATAPGYNVWTDLQDNAGDVDLPATPSWRPVVYNVTSFVGQRVRFRLNFTSDAAGNGAPGFFIRNFAINGPSRYVGTIESTETDYLVGTLSFQDFDMRTSRAHLIRTPAGEVLLYGSAYDSSSPPNDVTRFRGFDFFENPQILFVILLVTAYLTSWLQDKIFYGYRERHPLKYRMSSARIGWLVWVARAFIILFVLFYFLPSFFVLFGASNAFVTGPTFWAFSISSTAGLAVVTWAIYERRAKFIPPEEGEGELAPGFAGEGAAPEVLPPPPEGEGAGPMARQRVLTCAHCGNEIEDLKAALKCRCGQVYHESCAADIGRCPNCQRVLEVTRPAERRMVTAKCPACGEIQVVPETADLMQTRCEACGALLKEIERGFNYLVLAPENDLALEWFHSIVKKNVPGLAMSTTFPDNLRKEFGFEGVDLYWLTDTDTGPKSIDPKRVDFEMMRTISNFIKRTKGGALLIEGLEYLVVENSFDHVLKFVKKVNDLASVHEVTLIIPVTAGSLGLDELTLLRKEFDRVIETTGRASPAPPKP
ncbi:MAG: DUF835 domain-containing protein [Methanobacteriota archaeon]|nr:MAG: DUF835 domain-containing protein [Euryarchaeota archaeon]